MKKIDIIAKIFLSFYVIFIAFSSVLFAQEDIYSLPKIERTDSHILGGNKNTISKNHHGVIVKYKKERLNLSNATGYLSVRKMAIDKKLELIETQKKLNISLMDVSKEYQRDIDEMMGELLQDPFVESVQPNYIYEPLSLSNYNDTHKDKLWGFYNSGQTIGGKVGTPGADISWQNAMSVFSGSSDMTKTGVIVAVLDTGVAYNHPDLMNKMWDGSQCTDHEGNFLGGCIHGYDYDNNDKDPMIAMESHGTHVAGIIAAEVNNSGGILGINPHAKIMALKHETFTTLSIVNSLYFAKYNGAKIINASFGGYGWIDPLMYQAIKDFGESGGLFITSAGNGGKNHDIEGNYKIYPSGFHLDTIYNGQTLTGLTNIISVAATDNQDKLATFSDYGSGSVHIGAPGVGIYSTIQGSNQETLYEESFSGYNTGAIYNFLTGGLNNNFGANYGINGIWGDINYPFKTGSTQSYIEKKIDISSAKVPVVAFGAWCDAGKGNNQYYTDYMSVQVSTGGLFKEIDKLNYWNFNLETLATVGEKVGKYGILTYDLGEYKTSDFTLRFVWVSDTNESNDLGCVIYSFFDIYSFDDGSQGSLGYAQGTSMSAPYVAGLASLAWSYRPDLNYVDIKHALLENGDNILSLSGKTITGKRINAFKTLSSLIPPDSDPDPFDFQTLTGQIENTLIESNIITITGINTGALVQVLGGEYKVSTGAYTTQTGMIYSGDTLQLRHTTSSSGMENTQTTLQIGTITGTFITTTRILPDDIPDQFYFQNLFGQEIGREVESNPISITGINTGSVVSISGGEYKIGEGFYTTQTGMIYSGDVIRVKHTTSEYNLGQKDTILNIGGITGIFSSKTYTEQKQIILDMTQSGGLFQSGITIGSGFEYIEKQVPGEIFSFTGNILQNFLSGGIINASGSVFAHLEIATGSQLYTSTSSLNFEKKKISNEELTVGNVKQIFTGAIKIGGTQTILLDTPAKITFPYSDFAKVAYRKTGATQWNILNIHPNQCQVNIQTQPLCAYKQGNSIILQTYHFTDFALVKEENIPPPSGGGSSGGGGGGGGGGFISPVLVKDNCPSGDFSGNLYDKTCGIDPNAPKEEIVSKKDNNVEALKSYTLKKTKYLGYEIIDIQGYKLSLTTTKISKYIINNKKISKEDKKNFINRFNEFLQAKYKLDTSVPKTNDLKNKYNKQVLLLKSVIQKIIKINKSKNSKIYQK